MTVSIDDNTAALGPHIECDAMIVAAQSGDMVAQSRAVLGKHARTFRWASALLPADTRDDAAVAYAFCRYVDDLVDEAESNQEAETRLGEVVAKLDGQVEPDALTAAFIAMCASRNIPLSSARELCDAMATDLSLVRFEDDRALLRYCYGAAGTVGIMMCGVLGVTDPLAQAHAVDLGIGMQLTNICRDVMEDAERDRVYLPRVRLQNAGATHEAVIACNARAEVRSVVRDLLQLADTYYQSGDNGLRYIPLRARAAIGSAARMYRGIGNELRSVDCDPFEGRAFVSGFGKARLTCAGIARALIASVANRDAHDPSLHAHLDGFTVRHSVPQSQAR